MRTLLLAMLAAAADFTGRRAIDLITDSWGRNQVEMLTGDGRGGFSPGPFFDTGKRPYQRLRTADLNGDGRPDLVTTNLDGDSVTILLGDGHGGFHQPPGSPFRSAPAPWAVHIADVNRDGKLDLVIIPYDRDAKTRGGSANVTVLLGDGTGSFAPMAGSPFSLGACVQPSTVVAADLTRGLRAGYRLSLRPLPGKPEGLVAADFFGDGRPALAVSDSTGGAITLLRPVAP